MMRARGPAAELYSPAGPRLAARQWLRCVCSVSGVAMGVSVQVAASTAIQKRGNRLPNGAMDCTTLHAEVARLRWPRKTAFNWAVAAGVKQRMAKYWLAGKHPVSGDGKLAIIRELD